MMFSQNNLIPKSVSLFGCCLVLCTGCAQTFSGNLSELVAEPAMHEDLPVSERSELHDLKMETPAYEEVPDSHIGFDRSEDFTSDEWEDFTGDEWSQVENLPALIPEPNNQTVAPATSTTDAGDQNKFASNNVSTQVPPTSIINLQPMLPKTTLQDSDGLLAKSEAETNATPLSLQAAPTTPNPNSIVLPAAILHPIDKVINESDMSENVADLVDEANEFVPARPEIPHDMLSNQQIPSDLLSAAVPPSSSQQPDLQPVIPVPHLEEFISEQMQMLLPPFAGHPEMDECEDCSFSSEEPNDNFNQIYLPGIDLQADPNSNEPDKNDFVESLISSSLDPSAIEMVAASSSSSQLLPNSQSAPANWKEQLEATIAAFESELESADNQNRKGLERSLSILQGLHQSLQPTMADSAESRDLQEYWNHQLEALNAIVTNHDNNEQFSTTATEALSHLNRAALQLRNSANLQLKASRFCHKVVGFGQYESFDESTFRPNQQVLIYCELENFSPLKETADGETNFQTKISSSFWITNAAGEVVQTTDYPVVTDTARNLRRDFFMHLPIRFANLVPGSYELQVEVRDFGSGKTAQLDSAMQFEIR